MLVFLCFFTHLPWRRTRPFLHFGLVARFVDVAGAFEGAEAGVGSSGGGGRGLAGFAFAGGGGGGRREAAFDAGVIEVDEAGVWGKRLEAVVKKTSEPSGAASQNSDSEGLSPEEIR